MSLQESSWRKDANVLVLERISSCCHKVLVILPLFFSGYGVLWALLISSQPSASVRAFSLTFATLKCCNHCSGFLWQESDSGHPFRLGWGLLWGSHMGSGAVKQLLPWTFANPSGQWECSSWLCWILGSFEKLPSCSTMWDCALNIMVIHICCALLHFLQVAVESSVEQVLIFLNIWTELNL